MQNFSFFAHIRLSVVGKDFLVHHENNITHIGDCITKYKLKEILAKVIGNSSNDDKKIIIQVIKGLNPVPENDLYLIKFHEGLEKLCSYCLNCGIETEVLPEIQSYSVFLDSLSGTLIADNESINLSHGSKKSHVKKLRQTPNRG